MINRYLTPLFIVLVSLGVYFLYIDAAYKSTQSALLDEQVLDGLLVDANNAREKLDKIVSEFRAFPEDAPARLEVLLPDRIEPIRLIIDVDSVAQRHGLTLLTPTVTLATQDPTEPDTYLSHKMRFTVAATYPAFREFLQDLQSSLALRDFSNVSFSAPQEISVDAVKKTAPNPQFAVFEYDVELTSYSLP